MKEKKNKQKPHHNKLGKRHGGPDGVAGTPDDARRKESPYYLLRSRFNVGRKKKYETGEELFSVALDYFKDVDSNPMKETKVFGSGFKIDVPLQIPYTLSGFFLYAGIDAHMFNRYKGLDQMADATEEELSLSAAAHQIDQIIYTQKLEGATAGKFQHQIVALQLGLTAKIKNENVNYDTTQMTAAEIKKMNEELENDY